MSDRIISKATDVKVGSIFHSVWGCGARTNNYYEVVGHKGNQTILVRELRTKIIKDDKDRDFSLPEMGSYYNDTVISKKLMRSEWDGKEKYFIKIAQGESAYLKDRDTIFSSPQLELMD